jgi:hypothetical protein
MTERPQTNTEFITELMEYSKYGGLAQVFIIEAIRYYSEQVAKSNPTSVEDNQLISPKLWRAVATEVHEKLQKKYK